MPIDPIKKTTNEQLDNAKPTPNIETTKPNVNSDAEAEYVPLPSQGVFYKGKYKGLTQLKVRKLNWEDEDLLTTKSYYDNGTLFNEILKNCIVDENGFQAKDLLNVDRDAILWWLRIGAFGQEYIIPRACPSEDENGNKCNHKQNVTWDLGSFEMPDLNEEYYEELETNGCITITLPVSGLKCQVTLPTVGREIEIHKRLKVKKEKTKATKDFLITGRLIAVIKEAYAADGTVLKDSDEILNWLNTGWSGKKIPIVDSRYIQQKAREIDLRVNTQKDIVCKECGYTEEGVEMPMSIYFFWPEYTPIQRIPTEEY